MTDVASSEGQAVGALVAGRFRIERMIGRGGVATVYRATDIATGRTLALKLLKTEVAANQEAVSRLRREGQVLSAVKHPAIVQIETFGALEDGSVFIAMELLEGETLGERIRRRGRLDLTDLAPIVAGACAGLEAAHAQGVIHRDLKPDNVFIVAGPDGTEAIKLVDFGISKVYGSEKLTQTGEILGTPRYMAPEQLAADDDLDARVDVYALGAIVYEALSGKPAFLAATASDLIVAILQARVAPLRSARADVPAEVEAVVLRAMAKAREARFAHPAEFADAFLSAVGSDVAQARAVPAHRTGMATSPLGSLDPAALARVTAVGSNGGEADPEARPGTFSALAASPRVAPVEPPRIPTEILPSLSPVESSPVAPPAAPSPAGPSPAPAARVAARAGAAASSPASTKARSRPRSRSAADEYKLPSSGGRLLLAIGGVLAGAVSAVVAIIALQLLSSSPSDDARARSLDQARAALVRGDAPRCIALAETLLKADDGPPEALRLKGDCLLRAGDRRRAIQAYRSFCARAPSPASLAKVRTDLERLGTTCP